MEPLVPTNAHYRRDAARQIAVAREQLASDEAMRQRMRAMALLIEQ
jgi:hypothetical protein